MNKMTEKIEPFHHPTGQEQKREGEPSNSSSVEEYQKVDNKRLKERNYRRCVGDARTSRAM